MRKWDINGFNFLNHNSQSQHAYFNSINKQSRKSVGLSGVTERLTSPGNITPHGIKNKTKILPFFSEQYQEHSGDGDSEYQKQMSG